MNTKINDAVPVAWLIQRNGNTVACMSSKPGSLQVADDEVLVPVYAHPQPAALNEVSGNSGELGGDERARCDACAGIGEVFSDELDHGVDCPRCDGTGNQQGGEVEGDTGEHIKALEAATHWSSTSRPFKAALLAGMAALAARQPVEMSPDFTDTARAAIAWVLWHHQGGSSPVGQPLRFALGMGQHDRMTDQQIAEAKRFAAWAGASSEGFHRRDRAQGIDLGPIATRKLDDLAAQGYVTNGVAIFNPATGQRGLVDNLGFVGWVGAQGIDLGPLRRLYQAYVRLLESGRDRIIDLGGTCDPVDVMERMDVDLIEARVMIDSRRDAGAGVE